MRKANTLIVDISKFQNNEDEWRAKVGETIMNLFDLGYQVIAREEETGIVVIEFDWDTSHSFGCYFPEWLDEDEYDLIMTKRKEEEDE